MRPDPCFVEHWDPCWLKFIHMPPLQMQHEARELSEMLCQILRRCYKSCRAWRALSHSLSFSPAPALTLPAASFRGCPLLQEHPVHWWQVFGHFSSSADGCAQHAQQIDREQREGRRESRSRDWERESASRAAWKSASATAALTLSATVNSLLTCAKPFVYFCLAADTKKITKRAAKIKGRAQKCCKSKIRQKQLSQACNECCSRPVALFILAQRH